jgi:hypothetical protein
VSNVSFAPDWVLFCNIRLKCKDSSKLLSCALICRIRFHPRQRRNNEPAGRCAPASFVWSPLMAVEVYKTKDKIFHRRCVHSHIVCTSCRPRAERGRDRGVCCGVGDMARKAQRNPTSAAHRRSAEPVVSGTPNSWSSSHNVLCSL